MIRLAQRHLIIPRGDTGTFSIPMLATTNTGDYSVFTIFDPLLHKKIFEKIMTVNDGVLSIDFTHNDTVNLPVGEYVWDIKFYKNALIVDDVFVNGDEVDSYYAAFKLPICEIRETGDSLLMADDAPESKISPTQLNIITAAINDMERDKLAAAGSASDAADAKETAISKAGEAANSASNAASAAETATQALADLQAIVYTIPTKVSDLPNDANYAIDQRFPSCVILKQTSPRVNVVKLPLHICL